MVNIGFLSYWGFGRGQSYVTLCFIKMLQEKHNCFVLNQVINNLKPEKEFEEVKVNITDYKGYFVDQEVFKTWIKINKLDAVVFAEYDQWAKDKNDLIQIAKDQGCKVYGWLVHEKFEREQALRYDRVFALTVSGARLFRMFKIRNFTYIPFSVDLKKHSIDTPKNEKFTFYHPGGMLGVNNRKNTMEVIEAFENLNRDDAELIITSQKELQFNRELHPNIKIINKNISKEEINELYARADFLIYPTKWETIGIGIIEAMASGTPAIVSDAPPMNEFIIPNKNGFLVNVDLVNIEGIKCKAAQIHIDDLTKKMDLAMNPVFYDMIIKNSKYIAEEIYNLEKNKHYFLDFLEKEFKGEKK